MKIHKIDWIQIRALGQLTFLTRASYLLLIFVPVLAALWPAVRSGINRYNGAIQESLEALEVASVHFQQISANANVDGTTAQKLVFLSDSLNEQLGNITASTAAMTISHLDLPFVWVSGFLAALFVALAHLLFQAFAPTIVQQASVKEHSNSEVKRFNELKSDGQLSLAAKMVKEYEQDHQVLFDKGQFQPWSNLGAKVFPESTPSFGDRQEEIAKNRQPVEIIEGGAMAEYILASQQDYKISTCCGYMYLCGLGFIVYITITQTVAVLSAGGKWLS